MINLLTKPYDIEPSPKPWPDRDWDNMRGTFMGPEQIRSMKPDKLHRDRYSTAERLEAWEYVNACHHWARKWNRGKPQKTGIYLVSGAMGSGKSLWMIGVALMAWMFQAIPVFSTESLGALFGYRLDLPELFNFSDVIDDGSILLIDEVAALVDSRTGSANRGRVIHAGLTSFRKGGNLAITGTAAEHSVSWQIRASAEAVIQPKRGTPIKRVITGYDRRNKPIEKIYRLREHELKYPLFCHVFAEGLVLPWVGKRVFEDYEHQLSEARLKSSSDRNRQLREVLSKWHEQEVLCPTPYIMDLAAKLYDTFQRVPVSDALDIGSQEMAAASGAARASKMGATESQQFDQLLKTLRRQGVFREYGDGKCDLDYVHAAVRAYGGKGMKGISKAQVKRLCKELYPEQTSKRMLRLSALER